MKDGAEGGTAIDIDDRSLTMAARNLSNFLTLRLERKSAYEVDWDGSFDISFSIGVIHHLEFPADAILRMARATKPGGDVAIWVYGRENNGWLLWALNPTRKLLFSWLPISWVHFLSLFPTMLLWILLRCGLSRLEYFRLLQRFGFAHLRSIVFDQMLPRIANYWRRHEVEALMRSAGLVDIELAWVNEMSWAARGKRPT